MKFTTATVALLAATASAANIKRQESESGTEVTISIPDIGSKINSLTSKIGNLVPEPTDVAADVTSKVSEIISGIKSEATDIVSDVKSIGDAITSKVGSKAAEITSFIGSAVADGITLTIPALPTASIDTEALKQYISKLESQLAPDVVSSIKNGQTPAVVTSFIDALPTEYKTVASAAFSEAAQSTSTPSNGGSSNGSGSGSAAPPRINLTGLMATAVVAVAGLAIYL